VRGEARYKIMAVRREKRKSKTKRMAFKLGTSKKKYKTDSQSPSSIGILKALAVVGVLAALVVGFVFLEKKVPPASGKIIPELADTPAWVNQSLRDKIIAAATIGSKDLKPDENAARSIQNNLAKEVTWLQNVKVQITHDNILIKADYRKPIALVKAGLRKFYVDAELVILDFIPMSDLHIVEVKGLSPITKMPLVGKVWQREDLTAAVAVLDLLDRRDQEDPSVKPLLSQIDRIDISNFNGRKDSRFAHIILYAKDNTEIIWGAEIDAWQRHLESTDEQKLAKLYHHYKEYGTLLNNNVKYINLRDPQDTIPLPIDKY